MFSGTLNKSILRKVYLKERMAFSEEEIEEYSSQIFENFKKSFPVFEGMNISIFLPINKFNEIKTRNFIDFFWENGINVFVPKLLNGEMISVKLDRATKLIENSWGIFEPESNEDSSEKQFDVVFTPLLYCDHKGNRIGYGKGFYDQFFRKINQESLKIGLNLFTPNELIADVSTEDVALDYLVTPTEILSFFAGTSKSTK